MTLPAEFRITFLPAGRTVWGRRGESLIAVARRAGLHVNASCGGDGVCGKCRVIVEEGGVTGGGGEKISPADYGAGHRLACCSLIESDLTVRIPAESGLGTGGLTTDVAARNRARMHVYDIDELRQNGLFLPPVEKFFLELPRASHADNMADAARITTALNHQYGERGMIIPLPVLRKIPGAIRGDDFRVTVTLARPVRRGNNFILDIQAGNWTQRNFGLAVDIGTTSIYAILIDLNSGKVLARGGDYNAQLGYGEDVISRIIHGEKPGGLEQMQKLVVGTINQVLDSLLARAHPPGEQKQGRVRREEIGSLTLAANTTMTHLLLGLDPRHIRRAPYVPVSTFLPPVRAADLGINLPNHTVALAYPAISSYVGGDIVAGVMGSGMYRTDKVTLYIDIGTNAEIVIGNREWLVCAACSAGPAFEGGGITHGMRASRGAIEDFQLDPATLEPTLTTVGHQPPLGICGSGLLILIATLFEHGIIDSRGKFNRKLTSPRLRAGNSGWEYLLAAAGESGTGHDLVLNEVDIENFIRAKAAIYAGAKTLVEEVGLAMADLEQVILAGAFGSYLDLDAAITVGLLPEIEAEKILYVGNGSLMGAWMSEMSNHIRRDVVAVVRRMTSFELSEVHAFQEQYTASQFLPHTNLDLFPAVKGRLAARNKPL
ncbi:ASKHA domain-containing protein [Desulfurivibrio sp. D14AmB]|uniref:ASKHA domain-containing protein n=1 Tax=Desulfurivibrio sp. D14AmB TaxID=3374370 RepID=UPI00376EF113